MKKNKKNLLSEILIKYIIRANLLDCNDLKYEIS